MAKMKMVKNGKNDQNGWQKGTKWSKIGQKWQK